MNATTTLTLLRRNTTVFWRDRGQVFFALLAPLILLMLYVLFLGQMQVDQLVAANVGTTTESVNAFVYSWVLAGMVLITTLSASLSAASIFVDDRMSGRFKEFRVSPIRSTELAIGYLVSGVVTSLVLSLGVLVIGSVALGLLYGTWATAGGYLTAALYTVILCFAFSSIAALATTFVGSLGALSGLSTLVGTLSGFVAFAYIPIGAVSELVGSILNTLPFAQGAMLLRDPLAGPALTAMVEEMPEPARAAALEEFRTFYGFDAFVGDFEVTPVMVIVLLILLTVVSTALAAWRIRRMTKLDMR